MWERAASDACAAFYCRAPCGRDRRDAALFIVGLSLPLAAAMMVMLRRGFSLAPPLMAAMAGLAFRSGSGEGILPAARIPLILPGKPPAGISLRRHLSGGARESRLMHLARMARYSIASSASTEAGKSSPRALVV
jgi:hypothetical protein